MTARLRPTRKENLLSIGKPVIAAIERLAPGIRIEGASHGATGDPARTRDVRDRVRKVLHEGHYGLAVDAMAEGDDPAFGVVKGLDSTHSVDGHQFAIGGTDPEAISFLLPPNPCEVRSDRRTTELAAWGNGNYAVSRKSGRKTEVGIRLPPRTGITGPWTVSLAPAHGAPEDFTLEQLAPLSGHSDPGVKYFSGPVSCSTSFRVSRSLITEGRVSKLNLGDVLVTARVKLNGMDPGLLWRAPHPIIANDWLRGGVNELEVEATSLRPNRLVGDEQLPEDSGRHGGGTLRSRPQRASDGDPCPTGRVTFSSWRLWEKDEPLLKSGMIGPVTLQIGRETALR